MIKIINQQEFSSFLKSVSELKLYWPDTELISIFKDFVEDREDDEIDVKGYFLDEELIGLIRWGNESPDYLFEESDDENDIAFIGSLFVHPNYRNKGIGRSLVEHVIKEMEQDVVYTSPIDIAAERFFYEVDFNPVDEEGYCDIFKKAI